MPIDHAVINSKREFSAAQTSHSGLTACKLSSTLTHRTSKQPMITIPFSYHVGGALSWNDPTYIKRKADRALSNAITQGKFAYILGPRQTGKSSLRIQTRHQLVQQGYRCVTVHANQLCNTTKASATISTPEEGCSAFISTLWTDLNLNKTTALRAWLKATAALPVSERLAHFSSSILLGELRKTPVVIFIDEIDALLETPFLVDLLQWIQQCNSDRNTEATYKNLNFVLLGTTTASELSSTCPAGTAQLQPTAEPSDDIEMLFSNGCQISLPPFQLLETFSLQQGFEEKIDNPTALLKAIFKWTQGQPFLTQKICCLASGLMDTLVQPSYKPIVLSTKTINQWTDNLVRSHIIKNWTTQDDPIHFRAIRDRFIYSPHSKALLTLYKTIYAGTPVLANDRPLQAELRLLGIVSILNGHLQIANPVYREIFSVKQSRLSKVG